MAGACLSTTRARCRTGGPVARPAHGRGAVPARSTAGGRLRPGVPPRPRPRPRARSHARRRTTRQEPRRCTGTCSRACDCSPGSSRRVWPRSRRSASSPTCAMSRRRVPVRPGVTTQWARITSSSAPTTSRRWDCRCCGDAGSRGRKKRVGGRARRRDSRAARTAAVARPGSRGPSLLRFVTRDAAAAPQPPREVVGVVPGSDTTCSIGSPRPTSIFRWAAMRVPR